MSSGSVPGGGKKSVNVELNLVPFIDLLSTLICFLLITAVWSQITALNTNTGATTAGENAKPPDEKKVDLSVSLLTDHVELTEGTQPIMLRHINNEPDVEGMARVLQTWKQKYPDRSDLILYSDSQAPYRFLIKMMDTMVANKFEDVGVNTN